MIEIILITRPCSHHINSRLKPNIVSPSMSRVWLLLPALLLPAHGYQHFFGPPAVGFGVGLVSVHRNFSVATSIVSRRSSRSYSQQSFVQSTPFGTSGSDSFIFVLYLFNSLPGYNRRSYTTTDHFYAANNLNYYQPNIFYYHSTPWHYR